MSKEKEAVTELVSGESDIGCILPYKITNASNKELFGLRNIENNEIGYFGRQVIAGDECWEKFTNYNT